MGEKKLRRHLRRVIRDARLAGWNAGWDASLEEVQDVERYGAKLRAKYEAQEAK